jgi:hypothetical protein
MAGFKDAFGRFAPPKEWELVAFGLAIFAIMSVPIAYFLHSIAGVHGVWNVVPVVVALIGLGLWLRRKRIANSRPVLSNRNDS